MMMTECPDCEKRFHGTQCVCGYKIPKQEKAEPKGQTFKCAANGCPCIGGHGMSIKGGGPYLCNEHWLARDEPEKWGEITKRLQQNPPEKKRDWRDEMVDELMAKKGLI